MPKRSPGTPDHRPPMPPVNPPVDPTPPQRTLLLRLVNLQSAVLPELRTGSQVVLKERDGAISVVTPLGSRIGDVSGHDIERLEGLHVIAATIHELGLAPPLVVIEVLVV